MSKNYYSAAIILFAVQLILLTMLMNNMLLDRFNYFQPFAGEMVEMFMGATIFVLNIAAIYVIRNLYLSSLRAQRLHIDSLKYKHIEEQNRIYRQHRHDLNNHLGIISGLAELGEISRLRNYLSSYVEDFQKSIISVETGLQELDVLLYAKISEATTKDVEVSFNCQTTVTCSQSHIISFIAILANALDNAIEACERVERGRKLQVKITADPVDYIFSIANTFDRGIDLGNHLQTVGFTSKAGSKGGEGLSIIKKTVQFFEGECHIEIKDNWFYLKLELPKHRLEG